MTPQETLNLAFQRHQAGQLAEAEKMYRQVIAAEPNHADAIALLGILSHQTGGLDAAINLLTRAVALRPNDARYLRHLGLSQAAKGDFDSAAEAFRRVVRILPRDLEAHRNLVQVLSRKNDLKEAIAACRQAVELSPNDPAIQFHLANLLYRSGTADEAISLYQKVIAMKPDHAEAYGNLGIALQRSGNDGAIAAFEQAIKLQPDLALAHYNLARALQEIGQGPKAITHYDRTLELDPTHFAADANRLYALLFDPARDSAEILREEKRWNDKHARPLAPTSPPPFDAATNRRLRIGYVSPDFRHHVIGRNVLPFIARHDRTQYEIFCYSNVTRPDDLTDRFKSLADHWRDVTTLTDADAADLIRADKIDVLVDLALHLAGNRLLIFAQKPAPIQVTFAGYPGGTGLTAIDYRLTDPYLDPPGQTDADYVERSIRFSSTFWCYDPAIAQEAAGEVVPPPSAASGHITFGCLNNLNKLNDSVLAIWSKLLDSVPNSRMFLLARPGSHRNGIARALGGRVYFTDFLPRKEYMEAYNRIDVSLDPFPYGGHTTALDSFWMGVPVVTLVGRTIVGRAGWSQLSNLKLTELAAHSEDEYLSIARNLAADAPRLAELRRTLRPRMLASPITDSEKFTRDIESALQAIWDNRCHPTSREVAQ